MEIKENEYSIEFSQDFTVPAETLFEAWTVPEKLKQWWYPMENSLSDVKNELEDGGEVLYEFEKKEFRVTGKYQQVRINEKLVYSWEWDFSNDLPDERYILTIGFEDKESGSILHVKQEGLPGEAAALPHQDAWKAALGSLKGFLENSSAQKYTV
ncbi:SRPBCC domain-containing protein [Dyadobacter sp. 3J3]|uniref:SRPBCC family protein n=1 Tax=Dyadobacter sp. 3J3 TaxID=2606600 RepID=UPI00135C80F0|nr:SRPBCC domain-containing protein [Dyadobacter sp. 3J3]